MRAWLVAAALVLATVLAYYPGLDGPFLFDDLPTITASSMLAAKRLDWVALRDAAYSGGERYPDRGLARVSFAVNYYLAGQRFDPAAFKSVNLAIHVANGLLVLALLARLLGRGEPPVEARRRAASILAAVLAAVWLLHPIQVTNVLYVVQRMNSLAALSVLAGLLAYVGGRERLERGARGGWTLLLGGGAAAMGLGFLSKQNALLLPLFAACIELFFLERAALATRDRRALQALGLVLVVLPLVAGMVLTAAGWERLYANYVGRPFDAFERVLTEARVLFFYLGLAAYPAIGRFGLFHDDFAVSRGLLEPPTTAVALAAWAVLLVAALTTGRRRRSPWAFAVLWYLSGHLMESTVVPLELIFEHRNYLPLIGPLVAAGLYLRALLGRWLAPRLRVAVVALTLATLGYATFVTAHMWADEYALSRFLAAHHPGSLRSQSALVAPELSVGKDVREIYAAQRDVLRSRPAAVLPLIEMTTLASGAERMVATPAGPPPDGRPRALPRDPLAADLVYDRTYLARLVETLDAEIRRRLMRVPISAQIAMSLISTRRCALAGVDRCVGIGGQLIAWHEIAIANPRREPRLGPMLEDSVARLYAAAGDYQGARRHARRAAASASPSLVYQYQAGVVALYIHFRRWAEAEQALRRLEHDTPWSPYLENTVKFFHEYLAEARAAEAATAPAAGS